MRSSYLLFIVAMLGVAALAYLLTQPQRLSPQAERLIREAVTEAVAAEFRQRSTEMDAAVQKKEELDAYVQRLVRERVAAELERAGPAMEGTVAGDAVALLEAKRGSEIRLRNLRRVSTDALINDAVRIASDIQAWKLKPAPFGGGADHDGFSAVAFEGLGYPQDDAGFFTSLSGRFRLEARRDTAYVVGTNAEHGVRVVVTVAGTKPYDIRTHISTLTPEE